MTTLRATVRVQLNRDFDFAAAASQVPYFAALGISHLYMSPIAMARPGSTHGYDVIDPGIVNPELGGEAGLNALVETLHAHDMGAILDIVPNHMAADAANAWWNDVLAQGKRSAYADYFDIEWDAPETGGKLWLPMLEASLEDTLEHHQLKIERHVGGVGVGLWLGETMLPVSETSLQWLFQHVGLLLADHGGTGCLFDAARLAMQDASMQAAVDQTISLVNADDAQLQQFLDLQHYCLGGWRDTGQLLNYRRFFDIHSLAALRVDRDEVFDAVHALPLRLIENGAIDGLRVDHIDGLSQPGQYLRRLRGQIDRYSQRNLQRRVTLHVEKILAPEETLRHDWPIDGSTGYDFMCEVGSLLHDPLDYAELGAAWEATTGLSADFAQEQRGARRYLLRTSLATELSRCARAFHHFMTLEHGDIAIDAWKHAVSDVLEHMPVYRSYVADGELAEVDRLMLELVFVHAKLNGDADSTPAFALLRRYLLEEDVHEQTDAAASLQSARSHFEQLSSALNAKAVEDTAFYRHGVLLCCNEVGGIPGTLRPEPESFHAAMQRRAAHWPNALLATATHDHKRGEDARARLAVLGENARCFVGNVDRWIDELGDRPQPSRPAQWMLFQTLLAAWPLGVDAADTQAMHVFARRIAQGFVKSEREAKLHTFWTAPDEHYEYAGKQLIDDLLLSDRYAHVRHELQTAARSLDAPGALHGLVATVLRLTVPGVPDLYQGTEYWDQSLVDPDNRRAVDYRIRSDTLDQDMTPAEMLDDYRNGVIKQHVIYRLLQLRKVWPKLFAEGTYQPIPVTGHQRRHVVAFLRQHGTHQLFVAVPRLCAKGMTDGNRPLVKTAFWKNALVSAAHTIEGCAYADLFTYRKHSVDSTGWPASELFSEWPVAVWIPASQADECAVFPH